MNPKFLISALVSATLITGCVPTTAWHNGEVTQNRANQEFTGCQVKASKEVPTSIERKNTGGYFIGYVYIPTSSDFDTNDQLRNKVVAQCMTGKGYQVVELPVCPANATKPDMNSSAVITEKSCFKSIPGGYYAIAEK